MELVQSRIDELAERIAEAGFTDRHRTETRQQFETVYRITPKNARENIETVFKLAIQTRSQPLAVEAYQTILNGVSPEDVLAATSRDAAFELLVDQKHIGQKVANEFLRMVVDVLTLNPEWREELHVALNTNVVQALVKTGAIEISNSEAREAKCKPDREYEPRQRPSETHCLP